MEHVGKAVSGFLEGKINASGLTAWAGRLESFDDVLPEGNNPEETDQIIQVIFELANPELSGCSLVDTAKFIRSLLLGKEPP